MMKTRWILLALAFLAPQSRASGFEETLRQGGEKAVSDARNARWRKVPKGVAYLSIFEYTLKNNVTLYFETGSILGSPSVFYFKKLRFGRYRVSTDAWPSPDYRNDLGCFSELRGSKDGLTGFTFETTLPDFVSESLGYGKRESQLRAETRIVPPVSATTFGTAESWISVTRDGFLIDSFQDRADAYPALVGSYEDFRAARQCGKAP